MKLEVHLYKKQIVQIPTKGKVVLGQVQEDLVCVYQAFNPKIAAYAVLNQQFGGSEYSFERMSWIKPNFLWMMYRAGWAQKEHQQRILAIWIPLEKLKFCIDNAVESSFNAEKYASKEEWQLALKKSEIRLQWDPDHNPYGAKEARRAVQLGLKGRMLKDFATEWVKQIEDITPFVHEQFQNVSEDKISQLQVPIEMVLFDEF